MARKELTAALWSPSILSSSVSRILSLKSQSTLHSQRPTRLRKMVLTSQHLAYIPLSFANSSDMSSIQLQDQRHRTAKAKKGPSTVMFQVFLIHHSKRSTALMDWSELSISLFRRPSTCRWCLSMLRRYPRS